MAIFLQLSAGAVLPGGFAGGPAALGTRGPPLERQRRQHGRGLCSAGGTGCCVTLLVNTLWLFNIAMV